LLRRHAEQHFHGQAGLNGCVTLVRLSAALASWHGLPGHGGIEPDRRRATALKRLVVGRPVPNLAGRGVGLPFPPAITLDSRDESPQAICATEPLVTRARTNVRLQVPSRSAVAPTTRAKRTLPLIPSTVSFGPNSTL
jgi:hypothetical protein